MKEGYRFFITFVAWFKRILYPFVFLVLLLSFVGTTFYQGEKHRRMISPLQESFLDLTFNFIGPRKSLGSEPQFFFKLTKELDWSQKKRTVFEILKKKPRVLFVFSLSSQMESLKKAKDLSRDLEAFNSLESRVYMGIPPGFSSELLKETKKGGRFVEGDLCEEGFQRVCSFNPKWKNWLGQILFEEFPLESSYHPATTNLHRNHPSYLLYFSKPQKAVVLSSKKDLDLIPQELRGRVVVLDLGESEMGSFSERTTESYYSQGLYEDSQFWSDLIRVFLDKDFIFVLEKPWVILLNGFFLLLILYFIFSFSFYGVFLGLFSVFSLLFFMNLSSVYFFRLYVPLVDVFIFYLFCILIISFLKISYSSYKRDIDLFEETKSYEMKKFRKTVLSIISHNLNTPLAQVSGLLDLLHYQARASDPQKLSHMERSLAQTYLNVKVFLTLISIQNRRVFPSRTSLEDFLLFFQREAKVCLKPLNIEVKIYSDDINRRNQLYVSTSLLSYLIFVFCFLFSRDEGESQITLMIASDNEAQEGDIFVNLHSSSPMISSFYDYQNLSKNSEVYHKLPEEEVLFYRFLQLVEERFDTHYFYKQEEKLLSLRISFLS